MRCVGRRCGGCADGSPSIDGWSRFRTVHMEFFLPHIRLTIFTPRNLDVFAHDLAQVTNGKLAIRVYPNASLLPAPGIKSAVRIGQVQIGEILISLHEHEHPIFGVNAVPFLATSYDEPRKLRAASKPTIARNLEAQGLIVLFAVPSPPQGSHRRVARESRP